MLLLPSPVLAARLTGLASSPGVVTITADGPPAVAHQFALDGPRRLVVDLPAVLDAPLAADGAGSVTRLRAAMFSPGVARLVIELSGPLEIVAARNSATGLTLTLRRINEADFATAVARGRRPLPVVSGGTTGAPTISPAAPPAAPAFELPQDMFQTRGNPPATAVPVPVLPPPPAPTTTATPDIPMVIPPPERASSRRRTTGVRPRNGSRPLVVIDAGHGGKDVGAISVNGGYEKEVTLAIARATAAALRRSGKVDVRLTRDDDRFIPLGGRVKIAQLARADLFVSIHADAAGNDQARGASVYTLSSVASDAVAARLAARENKADIIGGVNLGVEAPDVGDIMIDLSRRATGNVSVAFAETLQDELSDRIRFRGEFHHFAGFYVLKAPDVPSVLLETGYVTNRDDAELLFSSSGRKRVAAGVARAIERHLVGD
ncbi:N-acetylmuramoyl-L-alanine amidase [Sandarakinorhabdus sp. DWP1-3-1]|uniref:N-acetylmuramoyl-L-alanine amidase n=1 Tax=Sandarakinorhabdus sp. DWP1-3-1 TaxID=2804627 RepID=UPI003CF8E373